MLRLSTKSENVIKETRHQASYNHLVRSYESYLLLIFVDASTDYETITNY